MNNKDIGKYLALALLYVAITFFATPLLVSAPSTLLVIFGVLLLIITHAVYITWAWRRWAADSDEPHWVIGNKLDAYGHRFSRAQLEGIIARCNHFLNRYHKTKEPK